MKSKPVKHTLDNSDITESFFEGARLLGIQAPFKDYMFCWQVNQLLGVDFRINNEIDIQMTRTDPVKKNERAYFFPVYQYGQPSTNLMHYLYNNQHDGEYLLPELRHLDFLWLLKDDYIADEFFNDLIYSLRSINGVQLVVELTNEKIKNKEHLVF